MRNLIYLIIRYSALILFICLEFLSFYLIVNYNKSQKEIWTYSSNLITGKVYQKLESFEDYFTLGQQNDSLLQENARLRQTIINYRISSEENTFESFASVDTQGGYRLIPAMVCSKTLGLRNNYMTLCKGRKDSIDVGMGVISDQGIVGIIKSVSQQFATVLLINNSQSRISALIKNSNYPGSLVWANSNPEVLNLKDIPKHAHIAIGDTVVTSGYSVCFPPDIFIGTIRDFSIESGSNNYSIDVGLQQGLDRTEFVYVIKYLLMDEKEKTVAQEDE